MQQTCQNLHNCGRVFWKAQTIDLSPNRKVSQKRAVRESSEEMETAFRLPLNAQIIAELRSPIEDLIAANEALTSSPKIRRRPHIGS